MNLALNPFDKGKRPEVVENVELSSNLAEAVNRFFNNLNDWVAAYPNIASTDIFHKNKIVLEPTEINFAFAHLHDKIFEDRMGEYTEFLGFYISRLIRMSYDAGNSEFFLNTRERYYYRNMADKLFAEPDRELLLKVDGSVTPYFGSYSRHCRFEIKGTAGHNLAYSSEHCEFYVTGDVGEICGMSSNNCKFLVDGKAFKYCGAGSKDSEFFCKKGYGLYPGTNILDDGDLGCEVFEAKNCIFKTKSKAEFALLKRKLPGGNRVRYVE